MDSRTQNTPDEKAALECLQHNTLEEIKRLLELGVLVLDNLHSTYLNDMDNIRQRIIIACSGAEKSKRIGSQLVNGLEEGFFRATTPTEIQNLFSRIAHQAHSSLGINFPHYIPAKF